MVAEDREVFRKAGRSPDRLNLARTLSQQGQPDRAYAIALELHELAIQNTDDELIAQSADCLALCCVMMAQFEQGIHFARLARSMWHARRDLTREAWTSGLLAMLLAYIGEPEALGEADVCTDLAKQVDGIAETIWALQAFCLTLLLLQQPERGVAYAERAVHLGRRHGLPCLWAYLGLAECLTWVALRADKNAGESPSGIALVVPAFRSHINRAVELTSEALSIARDQGDGWFERVFINNIAEYSLYLGDATRAEAALAQFQGATGKATGRSRAHHALLRGRILMTQGHDGLALQAFENCHALTTSEDIELAGMCYLDLSNIHARMGAFQAALAAHRTYHELSMRRISEAAERRARLCALQREAEDLRAATNEAQALAQELAASNEFLVRETQRLLRTSLEDPLTGLPNRRKLNLALLDLTSRGESFALAIMDVDLFKQVNDRFSHPVGDAVLRTVADLLSLSASSEDLVVRYGGEEFVMLMRQPELLIITDKCERARRAISSHTWEALRPELRVTISIGAAASRESASHDGVLELADSRLYQAKQAGRDRVVT